MDSSVMVTKILALLAVALATSFIMGMLLGEKRKSRWFQKRTKASFFLRRGIFGEACHFGYPRTIEGVGVTIGMLLIIGAIFYLFIL